MFEQIVVKKKTFQNTPTIFFFFFSLLFLSPYFLYRLRFLSPSYFFLKKEISLELKVQRHNAKRVKTEKQNETKQKTTQNAIRIVYSIKSFRDKILKHTLTTLSKMNNNNKNILNIISWCDINDIKIVAIHDCLTTGRSVKTFHMFSIRLHNAILSLNFLFINVQCRYVWLYSYHNLRERYMNYLHV